MPSDQTSTADTLLQFLAEHPKEWYTASDIATQLSRPADTKHLETVLNTLHESKKVERRPGAFVDGCRQRQYRSLQRQVATSTATPKRPNWSLLRDARKAAGLTINEVAKTLGISPDRTRQLEISDMNKYRIKTLVGYFDAIGAVYSLTIDGKNVTPGLLPQLRQERESGGLTVADSAKRRGVSTSTILSYEHRDPSCHSLVSLDAYVWQVFGLRLIAYVGHRQIILPEPPSPKM